MKALRKLLCALGRRIALPPEQAETLAKIKFPCC